MKYKLKEVNRGLVLALILLIGVIVHVNWKRHEFKKDIPVIEQTIKELDEEVLKANLGDAKGYQRRVTSAVQDAYTGMGDIAKEVYCNKSTLLQMLDTSDDFGSDGEISDISIDIENSDIHSMGSGASVNVGYTLTMTYTGSPTYIDLSGRHYVDGNEDGAERRLKREGTFSCYMKKKNGSWKVVYIDDAMEYNDTEELVGSKGEASGEVKDDE